MQLPPYLQPGDTVAIAATARSLTLEQLTPCISLLEEAGYHVRLADALFDRHHRFAGTTERRAASFNQLLADRHVKGIFCARGGYGTTPMLDAVHLKQLKQTPKWIVGFSDCTGLLAAAAHHHVASLHAPVAKQMGAASTNPGVQQTLALLAGEPQDALAFKTEIAHNKKGTTEGILLGGNLSLLCHLIDTPYEYEYDGALLFIEETGEYAYHIHRMLVQLRRSGRLADLAGLLVGQVDNKPEPDDEPFGMSIADMVQEATAGYSYPVCYGLPVGHGEVNLPLVVGTRATLSVTAKEASLRYAGGQT